MPTTEEYRQEEAERADKRHQPIIDAHKRGLTHAEIARRVGKSSEWVRRVIYRARERGKLPPLNGQKTA
jgi:DNA-directed RNA polymerase specialized sigma24 family protein